MSGEKAVFVGPRLRRLRRDLGLTQIAMAAELDISPSYIALIERNQRPLTASVLLKLASIYDVDLSRFIGDGGTGLTRRVEDVLKDPLFAGLDLGPAEPRELAIGHPGLAEAFVRAHRAYVESQLALADKAETSRAGDPVEEARRFIARQNNHFAGIEASAERIGLAHGGSDALAKFLESRHGIKTRYLPKHVMAGAIRRHDPHRRELVLDESLEPAAAVFQIALQIAYLSLHEEIDHVLDGAAELSSDARLIARRALGNYAAGAILLPYRQFFEAAEECRYDIEILMRRFGSSFEQIAHRLTSLQRKGAEGVPFFFIRVDAAGNVSKRLDGSGFPFARHGGSCPLWSVHSVFRTPGKIVIQLLELPDGDRFLSVSRTVMAGGGAFAAHTAERAVALGCRTEHADRLVYADGRDVATDTPTPIGVSCRLCHRSECLARAEPPLGRQLLGDEYRRTAAPFLFGDEEIGK